MADEFVTPVPRPGAGTILFCYPPAGAGPSSFRTWPPLLPSTVELRVLALPGHERRITEPPAIDIALIADAVQAGADRPYAFYGHSLGGRIAFEVTRELRRRGARLPARCYLAASRPPHLPDPLSAVALAPDAELLAAVRDIGGVPPEVLDHPELVSLMLPAIRHDFTWYHDYRLADEPPLPVPLVAIAGEGDTVTRPELAAEWVRHTTAGFRAHVLPGDHFFFQSAARVVTELVAADLVASDPGLSRASGAHAASGGVVGKSEYDPVRGLPSALPEDHVDHRIHATHQNHGPQAAAGIDLVPLPGTGWQVWSSGLLRTAGFPADGLDLLAAPECAAVADEHLDGRTGREAFRATFDDAARAVGARLAGVAADPAFREAVTWQNPGAMIALDKLVAADPDRPSNNKRREREKIVARYWSRYCGKNDTVGFFGPVCWTSVTAAPDAVRGGPGPSLIRRRVVHLEWWALTAFADHYAGDPAVRRWFPLTRQPHHELRDGVLLRPGHPPLRLSPADAAVLALSDGRPANEVAGLAVADPDSGLRKENDVYLLADRLTGQELLRWRLDLPYDLSAESYLRSWVDGIGDEVVRHRIDADLRRLSKARDAVAGATGDAGEVRAAIERLGTEFTAVTGLEPRHRAGETYAGRALCYEDTERDLDLVIGEPVLAALAAPLDILLHAARWLTVAIADAYRAAFRALYEEMAAELGTADVPLGELWFLANGLVYGVGERPVDAVMAEFVRRWAGLLGLDALPPGTRRVDLASADLADLALRAFPADRPGWSAGRLHSPDLLLCAGSIDDLARGEFTAVLGELHAAWLTCTAGVFVQFHPDRDALVAAAHRDLGRRTVPLYSTDFPMLTARIADMLVGPGDHRVGHAAAPVWDQEQLVSVSGLTVSDVDGELVARDGRGRSWSLVELFGEFLGTFAADAYKLVGAAGHTPRVTIDRLVVSRETWRTTIGATGLAEVVHYPDRYLAARALRRALGLPDRMFTKVGTEIKPCYVDLTSPVSVSTLCTMLHAAHAEHGPDVPVTFTELLPTPEQAWVPDAQGRRYYSELRLHIRDPRTPARAAHQGGTQ
ncbi:MAG: lantibiotic dehydratase [Actinophytocola sp.]|uniref:thioesterase domain-containing protein n=1 Tax=Actinophytocola sp. TaxID=1872138 RepID=UPI0013261737|nr:thioesterase domain-containing protein [Actinophytocola sp.]MPZ81622.1 lantibiotic dehydratase [Actinophytocola sp.]